MFLENKSDLYVVCENINHVLRITNSLLLLLLFLLSNKPIANNDYT